MVGPGVLQAASRTSLLASPSTVAGTQSDGTPPLNQAVPLAARVVEKNVGMATAKITRTPNTAATTIRTTRPRLTGRVCPVRYGAGPQMGGGPQALVGADVAMGPGAQLGDPAAGGTVELSGGPQAAG